MSGTEGRVYGGDPNLLHVPDGQREEVGRVVASDVMYQIRLAEFNNRESGPFDTEKPLCPGCYMVVLFNAALALAKANGQSTRELGLTLGNAFMALGEGTADDRAIEEIRVILDPPEATCPI